MNENVAHSICRQCGRPIIWARRADNPERWSRPLDPVTSTGAAVIDDAGMVRWTHVYQFHSCNPDDIISYAGALIAAASIREHQEQEKINPASEEVRAERSYALSLRNHEAAESRYNGIVNALAVDCPKCDAGIGETCTNMSKGTVNFGNMIMHPHVQRINSVPKKVSNQ